VSVVGCEFQVRAAQAGGAEAFGSGADERRWEEPAGAPASNSRRIPTLCASVKGLLRVGGVP
jgi:hypothetical protein